VWDFISGYHTNSDLHALLMTGIMGAITPSDTPTPYPENIGEENTANYTTTKPESD
jgi:hypothetical protein